MREIIEVSRLGKEPSRIVIGDVVNSLENYLPEGKPVIVIADEHVYHTYRSIIGRYDYCLIGLGETNKTLATAQRLYGELLNLGADRSTFILGFGGGIVTDVTGYVASTYMRGLSFGFVASTLLAQVDASVGGKNGVNFEGYKNMVGTFNQPDFVLCDLSLLDTLPEREFKSGLAEIIKSGLIADPELFKLFETHTLKEFRENRTLLLEAVHRAVRVKADIVERDEREQGDRRKLNLGHTFAHAIEKSTREYLHGEAVAIGLVMIAALSVQQGTLTQEEADRVRAVVEKMGLPVQSGVELPQLLQALKLDKKKAAKSVNFVLMDGLGSCQIQPFTFGEIDRIRL